MELIPQRSQGPNSSGGVWVIGAVDRLAGWRKNKFVGEECLGEGSKKRVDFIESLLS
jgi:hypothetical protein